MMPTVPYPASEECPEAEAPPRRKAPRRCRTAQGTCRTPQTGSGTRTRSPATKRKYDIQSRLCLKHLQVF
jgi:hypothetical protein